MEFRSVCFPALDLLTMVTFRAPALIVLSVYFSWTDFNILKDRFWSYPYKFVSSISFRDTSDFYLFKPSFKCFFSNLKLIYSWWYLIQYLSFSSYQTEQSWQVVARNRLVTSLYSPSLHSSQMFLHINEQVISSYEQWRMKAIINFTCQFSMTCKEWLTFDWWHKLKKYLIYKLWSVAFFSKWFPNLLKPSLLFIGYLVTCVFSKAKKL